MKLFELDPNNPVDQELKKSASDAEMSGSMDPNDIEAQGDPMDEPDPAMDQMPPAEEVPEDPIDSDLLSIMKSHDYMKYDHSDLTKSSNPIKLMGLGMDEISQLLNKVTVYLQHDDINNTSYTQDDDNEAYNAAADMKSFLERIFAYKKQAAKTEHTASGNPPKVRTQKESTVKSGQKFKHKRQ